MDSMAALLIDIQRLEEDLDTLATFSAAPAPAVTRVLFSDEDMAARAFLKKRFTDLGLQVREDALGNTFARWTGHQPDLPPVATGSHIDAIPFAGRFDGTVGVLGALEAVRALQASGFTPARSIDIIMFTAEEPTRFGIGCLGSRALAGVLTVEGLLELRDDQGHSPDEVRRTRALAGELSDVALAPGCYHAFIELHIEQGPLLERHHLDLGIVSAIAAPASLTVTVRGEGGHAGAVLMPQRCDALTAAAEMALAVEGVARKANSNDSVATVGRFDVHPGAVNSIPSRVTFTIDCRDTDLERRDGMVASIRQHINTISDARGLTTEVTVLNADAPATCAPLVTDACHEAAEALELRSQSMVSRAYHDSLFMAQICPMGMLFIPCRDGISHRPDEYSSPAAIAKGVRALAHVLGTLAG
jgi:N-carbamoyl-L-amino-acid hydrolase